MKNKKIWLYLLIICLFSGQTTIGAPKASLPITHDIFVQEDCPNGGLVKIVLRMDAHKVGRSPISDGHYPKEILPGSIHFSDNIIYTGDTLFEFDLTNDSVSEKFITVDIPKNDTSWVMFRFLEKYDDYKYFVTTKDTVEVYDNDPLYHLKFRQGGPGAYMYDTTLPRPTQKPKPKEPKRGEVFPPKKIEVLEANPEDVQRDMMRRLEEKPLTDRRSEEIKVGDRWYQRFRGETKFKLVEPQTEGKKDIDQLYQEWKDSVDSIPDDTPYKACLFLDDTVKYRIADELIDNKLEPTGHPYRYHVTTTKGILYKLLKEYKIKLNFRNERDHIHLDSNETRFISPQ